ncbi:hypothetical protein KBD20_01235 [Candidatus Saccharibacteria bacterium]|nr:hypothetical protein [Candidatus Saccharibacteria bacterium]
MSKKKKYSALDFEPTDLVREVSTEAIEYYAAELGGLYLPDEFVLRNKNVYGVKNWNPRDRLSGKFGRFIVGCDDDSFEDTDIIMIGTTIGLGGFDRDYGMRSLRHYEFRDSLYATLVKRGLSDSDSLHTHAVDYGAIYITLGKQRKPESVAVYGQSLDYGRADSAGRQLTCEIFQTIVGEGIEVVNQEPTPRERQYIIRE